ncbi:hypothetical protein [Micromonospora sp. ATA51]|uniref:hypothetical protein n=1 Tax=Micromonospora sp. ATA51 TaxID=2806098 RepID=UPI001EE4523D|nr:hypothetical protein [Micromonospora sp. ATA51]
MSTPESKWQAPETAASGFTDTKSASTLSCPTVAFWLRCTCRPSRTLVVTRAPANATRPSPCTRSAPTLASGCTRLAAGSPRSAIRWSISRRTRGSPTPSTWWAGPGRSRSRSVPPRYAASSR